MRARPLEWGGPVGCRRGYRGRGEGRGEGKGKDGHLALGGFSVRRRACGGTRPQPVEGICVAIYGWGLRADGRAVGMSLVYSLVHYWVSIRTMWELDH